MMIFPPRRIVSTRNDVPVASPKRTVAAAGSPRKGASAAAAAKVRTKARDVIELPAPYSAIRSDDMKWWG